MTLREKYNALEQDKDHYYAELRKAETLLNDARRTQQKSLDNIIDVFGLRDAYPNTRVEEKSNLPGVIAIQYPVFGRDAFLDDVRLSLDAARGTEATERLAAALKTRSTK